MKKKPLVVITGASAGIGAEIARTFAKEGHPVALLARRLHKLLELKNEIDGEVYIYESDVQNRESVFQIMKDIEEKVGPIEILVNNAGAAFGRDLAHLSKIEDWEKMVDLNIKGLMYCTRSVLDKMIERDSGHIINIGSVAGTYPYPGGNVYGGTKAFVHQFSLNLRADLLGKKIRVSCIEPGLVGGSEFSVVRLGGDMQKALKIYENTEPLIASDIAQVVYFCYNLPARVNINLVEVMPTFQACASLSVFRGENH